MGTQIVSTLLFFQEINSFVPCILEDISGAMDLKTTSGKTLSFKRAAFASASFDFKQSGAIVMSFVT